jgi:hypothetical protein
LPFWSDRGLPLWLAQPIQNLPGCLRKPVVPFGLPCGRQVELLGFHLEPGCVFGGESPRPVSEEVARRLYPNESAVWVGEPAKSDGPAWLCVAYLYSDTPAQAGGVGNYSVLLVGGLFCDISVSVRAMVCGLLAGITWEAVATDDAMW